MKSTNFYSMKFKLGLKGKILLLFVDCDCWSKYSNTFSYLIKLKNQLMTKLLFFSDMNFFCKTKLVKASLNQFVITVL